MRIILRTEHFVYLHNAFVYDYKNGEIEYLTNKELNLIQSKIDLSRGHVKPVTGELAKIILTKYKFELFKDNLLSVSIAYDEEECDWLLCIDSLNNRLGFRVKSRDIKDNCFVVSDSTDNYCSTIIPDIYAEYLITNESARKREVSKILSNVAFRWVDGNSVAHECLGVSNILL